MNLKLASHIDAAILPLAVALYVVGVFLKSTPKVKDWVIPWILLVLSIIAANLLLGFGISSVIQGILACGVAVLGNQLYKQAQIGLKASSKEKDGE